MAKVFSNELKAILVMEDVSSPEAAVWQDKSFTVQQFSYDCRRDRNQQGEPYGATLPSFLDFTIRVSSGDSAREFFERMYEREPFPYSFLFNARFDAQRKMSEYEDAMVASGYIIDVLESYDNEPQPDGSSEQMLISARLLLCHLAYLGKENVLKLIINND